MARDDWARNTRWSERLSDNFFRKLGRAQQKQRYLALQMRCLIETHPEVVLELHDRYLELPYDNITAAQAFESRALAEEKLGLFGQATQSFRQALVYERKFPNVRCQAWINLPTMVARHDLSDQVEEIGKLLLQNEGRAFFPKEVFRWSAAMAYVAYRRGDLANARSFAKQSINAAKCSDTELRYHSKVGLVDEHETKTPYFRQLTRWAKDPDADMLQ